MFFSFTLHLESKKELIQFYYLSLLYRLQVLKFGKICVKKCLCEYVLYNLQSCSEVNLAPMIQKPDCNHQLFNGMIIVNKNTIKLGL